MPYAAFNLGRLKEYYYEEYVINIFSKPRSKMSTRSTKVLITFDRVMLQKSYRNI